MKVMFHDLLMQPKRVWTIRISFISRAL